MASQTDTSDRTHRRCGDASPGRLDTGFLGLLGHAAPSNWRCPRPLAQGRERYAGAGCRLHPLGGPQMLRRLRPRSIYDLFALLALLVAVGGTSAYAANTIRSGDIIDNEVTTTDIRDDTLGFGGLFAQDLAAGSVRSSEVLDDSLISADIKNSSLTGGDLVDLTVRGGTTSASTRSPGRTCLDGSLEDEDLGVAFVNFTVRVMPCRRMTAGLIRSAASGPKAITCCSRQMRPPEAAGSCTASPTPTRRRTPGSRPATCLVVPDHPRRRAVQPARDRRRLRRARYSAGDVAGERGFVRKPLRVREKRRAARWNSGSGFGFRGWSRARPP